MNSYGLPGKEKMKKKIIVGFRVSLIQCNEYYYYQYKLPNTGP